MRHWDYMKKWAGQKAAILPDIHEMRKELSRNRELAGEVDECEREIVSAVLAEVHTEELNDRLHELNMDPLINYIIKMAFIYGMAAQMERTE